MEHGPPTLWPIEFEAKGISRARREGGSEHSLALPAYDNHIEFNTNMVQTTAQQNANDDQNAVSLAPCRASRPSCLRSSTDFT